MFNTAAPRRSTGKVVCLGVVAKGIPSLMLSAVVVKRRHAGVLVLTAVLHEWAACVHELLRDALS